MMNSGECYIVGRIFIPCITWEEKNKNAAIISLKSRLPLRDRFMCGRLSITADHFTGDSRGRARERAVIENAPEGEYDLSRSGIRFPNRPRL